jgi:hypothetical protein
VQVEDHRRGSSGRQRVQAGLAAGEANGAESGVLDPVADERAEALVVVDHEDRRPGVVGSRPRAVRGDLAALLLDDRGGKS